MCLNEVRTGPVLTKDGKVKIAGANIYCRRETFSVRRGFFGEKNFMWFFADGVGKKKRVSRLEMP
jgi:hypothetical protein